MNKFIYTTDWHLCFKQPTVRTDNVLEKQLEKLHQIIEICNAELPDFIIHGGDLFDCPRSADPTILNQVLSLLKLIKSPIYYVPGSHDMYGYNVQSFTQSYLGTLEAAGVLIILREKGIYKFPGDLYVGVLPAQLKNSIVDYKGFEAADIIVSHNMLTTTSAPYSHILISDIAKIFTKKIFLCGHNHSQFCEIINNNLFINTGPLIRTSSTEKNITPYLTVIVKDGHKLKSENKYIHVDSDVFVEKLIEKDSTDVRMTFNDVLKNTDIVFCDIYVLLDTVAKKLNIDAVYVQELKERLIYAEQQSAG